MQNFFFLTKSCYENNYIAIDQNKISSILATTDNYKFSHKHIKPTQQVTYSSILKTWHMFPISLIFPNSDRTPLCFHSFHRPMHPSGTTLGVLFLDNYVLIFAFVTGNSHTKRNKTRTRYEPFTHECCSRLYMRGYVRTNTRLTHSLTHLVILFSFGTLFSSDSFLSVKNT